MKSKLILLLLGFLLSASIYPDGMIISDPRFDIVSPFPLEVKFHKVDVKITNLLAVTAIDQVFYNPYNNRIEGYYYFPIPKGAVINKFSMFIDGKETAAELIDAEKARIIYEDIVRKQKDPALLEYIGLSLFKVRIFPIEPKSEKRIKIVYDEILIKENETIEYIYPLNTEKFSSTNIDDVAINVEIISDSGVNNVYCTSHDVQILRKDKNRVVAGYEEHQTRPDRNFKLYYTPGDSKIGFSVQAYKEKNSDGFFYLNINPGFDLKENEIDEKDVTFILDTSGSMKDEKLKQAQKALLYCIDHLNKNDRFEVIRFSTEAEALFNGLKAVSKQTIETAKNYINKFESLGGTHMEAALKLGLANSTGNAAGRTHIIIFITDGKPTIGETDQDKLIEIIKKNNSAGTRVFTFGIGYDINTHLLEKITEITKSYSSYITPEEDIEKKIAGFYTKIQSPVLMDLTVKFNGNVKISKFYPSILPDLFKGSSVTIIGRYSGSGPVKILLEGKIKNKNQKYEYSAVFPDTNQNNETLASLWAARRIGYLLEEIRLHGIEKEIIEEITLLAKTYGIITPYTSYLIIEDEENRVANKTLKIENQTLRSQAAPNSELYKQNKSDFNSISENTGKSSIQAGQELQNLNNADNFNQIKQGVERLNYKDNTGNTRNINQSVRNIQARAMYQSGDFWIDSLISENKDQQVIKIQFASNEYFKLLKDKPLAAGFLSLGKNVRFVLDGNIYEIFE